MITDRHDNDWEPVEAPPVKIPVLLFRYNPGHSTRQPDWENVRTTGAATASQFVEDAPHDDMARAAVADRSPGRYLVVFPADEAVRFVDVEVERNAVIRSFNHGGRGS